MGVPQPYDNPTPPNDPVSPYNPLNDPTGQYAGANNNGPVFFLAGNAIAGGVWTRTITVPFGKPVFFPVLNAFFVPINGDGTYGPDPCLTPLTLACALTVPPSYLVGANMAVQIDGGAPLDTAQIEQFRQTSTSYFSVALPADNVLDVIPIENYDHCVATGAGQPCSDLWVQDGFYITLDNLSVGTHILQFQGETAEGFSLDVTDTLIVTIPEPSTWAMISIGFAGLGIAAYRKRRM
jgi:PEP-CTERM motif